MQNKRTHSESQSEQALANKAKIIVLGLDVHKESIVVVRQIDGAMPQPAQRFSWAKFLDWIKKLIPQADKVMTCYEAGPFGYGLHRSLEALGVTNLVVCPRLWESNGVKTDKSDARELCTRLALYAAGNRKSFTTVYVPTPEQEQARAQARVREQFRSQRQRFEAQGRSLLLAHSFRLKGRWWQPKAWAELTPQLPQWLLEILETMRESLLDVHKKTLHLTKVLEAAKKEKLPCGFGPMSFEIMNREIGDWKRFSNRRQVSSYTGLCPREHSSGGSRRQGSINKHGNPHYARFSSN